MRRTVPASSLRSEIERSARTVPIDGVVRYARSAGDRDRDGLDGLAVADRRGGVGSSMSRVLPGGEAGDPRRRAGPCHEVKRMRDLMIHRLDSPGCSGGSRLREVFAARAVTARRAGLG